jgi:transcriptional regulator with XRE-family HTH domain
LEKYQQLSAKPDLRESKDLSQAALAKKAHISKNLVSLIETAASAPSLITLWRLAQALETNLSDLLEIEEPKLDTPPPSRTPRRS